MGRDALRSVRSRRVPTAAGFGAFVALLGVLVVAGVPARLSAVATTSAVLAVLVGVRRERPAQATGWYLVALALGLSAVPGLVGRPLLAPLYILGEIALVVALVVFVRGHGRLARATVVDAAIITVGFAAITWLYLLGAVLHRGAGQRDRPGVGRRRLRPRPRPHRRGLDHAARRAAPGSRRAAARRSASARSIVSHLLFLWSSLHGGHDAERPGRR